MKKFALVFFGICLVLVLFLVFLVVKDSKPTETSEPTVKNSMLYVIAQEAVKQELKSPSTANFPYSSEAIFIGGLTDSIYNVGSYVDSQNGFGAMIRSDFNVRLKYKGGEMDDYKNWQVLRVNIR